MAGVGNSGAGGMKRNTLGAVREGQAVRKIKRRTDVGLSLCMIYLFLRSNAGSGDTRRHSALRRCRHEARSLY